ncbi:heterokaryon incompatibility protein-domain-containing protein [Neurospora tetraspora]|uniref:Heterokaryon incompatibility protein-domain-containing protein n=1 Tax=Neurospora tetraspora TaxID=94610 RepID=A0AAE0JJZ0_9PEZI|nr:heterokaryon incompatibility protein-domain-containing protein [Neurospora tetraspora]
MASGTNLVLCANFFRSLRPTNPSSDHLFLRVRWAKSWIRYKEDLANIDLDTQTALRIVPHDTLLLDINVNAPLHAQDNQFMEQGNEDSNNKIAARRVDDRVNFKLIRSWLRFCRQHHQSHCHAGLDGIRDIPGFRVIDCASRKIMPWAEIPEDHDRSYTALSYLWGTDTSTATQDGKIPSPSPKVIEDAVTTTIELGFKYLWVDRYCITQHESELKAAQMKRMDDVYGSSAVTIIASAGDGPAYGLPEVSSTPRVPQKSVRVGSRTLIAINNDICKKIRDSKWNTRAWTLQEGLLSTRRLCFEDNQVYFQCNLMHRLESISIPPGTPKTANPATDINTSYLHGSGNRTSLFPINGIREGGYVVNAFRRYVTRHINYPSDGLQAFEGILRKAAMMRDPLYNVCGVFIRVFEKIDMTASLVVGLCWRVNLVVSREMRVIKAWEISYPGPLRHRLFPSWSWVDLVGKSTKKGITFRQPWELSGPLLASLSKYKTQPLTQSIAMEYVDGTTVLWESRYQDILLSAMTKEAPRTLRIHGYTSDVLLWKLPKVGCPDTKGPPSSKSVAPPCGNYRTSGSTMDGFGQTEIAVTVTSYSRGRRG